MSNFEEVRKFALRTEYLLRPYGQLDVLLLYRLSADACVDYLGDREIASQILIPNGPQLLKRGSKLEPLTAREIVEAVDRDFLRLRKEKRHLDDARSHITEKQEKVWKYFYPRKYCEFYYATNHEGKGKPISRIFYDIDREEGVTAGEALEVTRKFVDFLEEDSVVKDIMDRVTISWTGNSFHVDIDMKDEKPHSFYEDEILTTKSEKLDTITERAVRQINKQTDAEVRGGHEKKKGTIAVDPSQTPSGKLNRMPLGSLHMKDATTVDGVSVPLTEEDLHRDGIVEELKSYTPRKVVEDLSELARKI